ncbi:MAG: FAD-dependent oxidoreductase [Candidatus Binataceae bacterium]
MSRILNREAGLARLRAEEFDLAVIGGGINGAAIARDAAMRGLAVALIERGDFAGATSSRSSKLIHGGLRYLPQFQFKLVRSALRERERLRRLTAPHLVRPARFLFPIYRGRGAGRLAMAIGLSLYDIFARTPRAERHHSLSAAAALALEPALASAGLTGGATYYDAWADDARVTFENILDADLHGAAIANYAGVEGFVRAGGRIAAAGVRDSIGGGTFELRAKVFVNAAGPWIDEIRRMDDPGARPSVRLTKGVHLVFPRAAMPVREWLVLGAAGGRIVFAMPHERYVLAGTTDTDYAGDPAAVAAEPADVGYLLQVLAESLPGIKLKPEQVATSFAGLRALIRTDNGANAPSSVPREEVIVESASGLIAIAGGKLTTHREIAERVAGLVLARLGRPAGRCPTLDTPLPGARPPEIDGQRADDEAVMASLPEESRAILIARHGTRAAIVARVAAERPELANPLAPGCGAIGAEAAYAARAEMAQSLEDFIVRRASISWRWPGEAIAAAPIAAKIMAAELGWDAARERDEVERFTRGQIARRAAT